MPTYQYECDHCGYKFDILQGITESKLKKCPECHKETLQRLIGTGSGLILKGAGFYANDYQKKPCGNSQGSCPVKESCPEVSPKGGCGCSNNCGHQH
ncbi:MAG: FmdB family zinc ribbon protein [Candidatus Omnitrophota bacterium]